MPKTFNLNLTNNGFTFDDGNAATQVVVFEGDEFNFINQTADLQNVIVHHHLHGEGMKLFGDSPISVSQNSHTKVKVRETHSSPGASAHSTYTIWYGATSNSATVYVNTLMIHGAHPDDPAKVTVKPHAHLYFNSTAGKEVELKFEKHFNKKWVHTSDLIGHWKLHVSPGMSKEHKVEVNRGVYQVTDAGYTDTVKKAPDTSGDTITIKVDTTGAGTGLEDLG